MVNISYLVLIILCELVQTNLYFRFILFVLLYRLIPDNELEPVKHLIQQILDTDEKKSDLSREENLSIYPESSYYSDDVSKITMPSFESRCDRLISDQSTPYP